METALMNTCGLLLTMTAAIPTLGLGNVGNVVHPPEPWFSGRNHSNQIREYVAVDRCALRSSSSFPGRRNIRKWGNLEKQGVFIPE